MADLELLPCPFCGGTVEDGTLSFAHAGKYVMHSESDECTAFSRILVPCHQWNMRVFLPFGHKKDIASVECVAGVWRVSIREHHANFDDEASARGFSQAIVGLLPNDAQKAYNDTRLRLDAFDQGARAALRGVSEYIQHKRSCDMSSAFTEGKFCTCGLASRLPSVEDAASPQNEISKESQL